MADDSIEDIRQVHSWRALGHAKDKKIRPGIPHQGHLGIVTEIRKKKLETDGNHTIKYDKTPKDVSGNLNFDHINVKLK